MRILLTGRDGQVGWELRCSLQALGEVLAPGRDELDLAAPGRLGALLRALDPDLVVNAAAYTAVDRAESEPELAQAVNADAVGAIAQACAAAGCALVHYSTDYVYPGTGTGAHVETDPTGPLSVYGRTKLAGEEAIRASGAAHLILRTSWVYGLRGHNFLRTMLRLAREREVLRVVDDQVGAPTWSRSLAEATAALVARAGVDRQSLAATLSDRGGVFHLAAGGETTWHGFAAAIFAAVPDPQRVLRELVPIPSREYPTPARRPANSRLDGARLAASWNLRLPGWREALGLCVAAGGTVP